MNSYKSKQKYLGRAKQQNALQIGKRKLTKKLLKLLQSAHYTSQTEVSFLCRYNFLLAGKKESAFSHTAGLGPNLCNQVGGLQEQILLLLLALLNLTCPTQLPYSTVV